MANHNNSYSPPTEPLLLNPISIIDVFLPGSTSISAALQELLISTPNTYARMFCICGLAVFVGRYVKDLFKGFITTYFTPTVHVSYSNEAYDMLLSWVSSQPFSREASSSLVSVGARRRGLPDRRADGNQKKTLQYSPWNGTFSFYYRNHLFTFRSVQKENQFIRDQEISVSCISRSPRVLREFFSECRAEYLKLIQNKTSVFEHRDNIWKKTKAIDIRALDTVILDEVKKTAILEDIKAFLDPTTRSWYSQRGIPYRKGYLLYGPPGTGKSSLSLSIAGACDLDIYIANISGVDDTSLGELFAELPPRCVVLLEDIDAVNTTQSRQHSTSKTGQNKRNPSLNGNSQGRLSLSALLNVLDGVASQEGRVLIMTTNHIERLDTALIRPGRVDMKLELGYTDKNINAQMFRALFMRDHSSKDESQQEDEVALENFMTEFADQVPEQEFSPAEIQSFLLEYRRSPQLAVENVQEWVLRVREGKRQMKRANSSVLQDS